MPFSQVYHIAYSILMSKCFQCSNSEKIKSYSAQSTWFFLQMKCSSLRHLQCNTEWFWISLWYVLTMWVWIITEHFLHIKSETHKKSWLNNSRASFASITSPSELMLFKSESKTLCSARMLLSAVGPRIDSYRNCVQLQS